MLPDIRSYQVSAIQKLITKFIFISWNQFLTKMLLTNFLNFLLRNHHIDKFLHTDCNKNISEHHDSYVLCVNTESATFGEKLSYEVTRPDAIRSLCLMRATGKKKCILANVGSESVVFIDITYHHDTWKNIWRNVSKYYDLDRPYLPNSTNDMKLELYPALDHFTHSYSSVICELPRIHCEKDDFPVSNNYGPYFVPLQEPKLYRSILLEDDFEVLSIEISEHIHQAFNLLRVEASEILAFVATNSDRIIKHGIPPHLPVAYGLKGSSLSMETMRSMVFDVRKALEDRNISIMCKVYDGQFHSFIVRSKDNYPLTLLQLQKDHLFIE